MKKKKKTLGRVEYLNSLHHEAIRTIHFSSQLWWVLLSAYCQSIRYPTTICLGYSSTQAKGH